MDQALVLLCHSGEWDRLYQAFSAAAAAAAAGRPVTLVLYFGALQRVAANALDDAGSTPEASAQERAWAVRAQEVGTPDLSALLRAGRETGRVRVLACSASVALGGHDFQSLEGKVDEVVGWPTVLRIMDQARHVLYL